MKSLIIPMCGKSTRFPGLRPKWMLTHPMDLTLMCISSIKGLNLDFFDNIYFTYLKEHENKYNISASLKKSMSDLKLSEKTKITILETETSSQSETVYKTITENKIEGFIFVKDSDNYFELNLETTQNQISFSNLNKVGKIEACSKSYIEIDNKDIITNIVEKKVISPYFSVGGYGFESSNQFCEFFEKLQSYEGECYLSNVIFEMLLNGEIFTSKEVNNFQDWGTLEEWKNYCGKFSTMFVDLDGTLFTNTSSLVSPFIGEGKPLWENINVIKDLQSKKLTKIIITTSRPDKYREITEKELKEIGLEYEYIIMNLPHAKRILINDYSNTNPFPTAISININRDTETLRNFL